MLGLSSGLTSVSAPSSRVLLQTYTADWSSDVDGWTDYSGNDANFTFTRISSFGGSDGAGGTVTKNNVLQVDVNANETGYSGFGKDIAFNLQKGDYVELTFSIYLDSTQGAGDRWNGSDDVRWGVSQIGGELDHFDIEQNKWATISTVIGATLTNATLSSDLQPEDLVIIDTNDTILLYVYREEDRPLDGARIYIADVVQKHYRSALFT